MYNSALHFICGIILALGRSVWCEPCPHFEQPQHGYVICDQLIGKFCTTRCEPGFHYEREPAWAYVCNPQTKRWMTYPAESQLPWPDCVRDNTRNITVSRQDRQPSFHTENVFRESDRASDKIFMTMSSFGDKSMPGKISTELNNKSQELVRPIEDRKSRVDSGKVPETENGEKRSPGQSTRTIPTTISGAESNSSNFSLPSCAPNVKHNQSEIVSSQLVQCKDDSRTIASTVNVTNTTTKLIGDKKELNANNVSTAALVQDVASLNSSEAHPTQTLSNATSLNQKSSSISNEYLSSQLEVSNRNPGLRQTPDSLAQNGSELKVAIQTNAANTHRSEKASNTSWDKNSSQAAPSLTDAASPLRPMGAKLQDVQKTTNATDYRTAEKRFEHSHTLSHVASLLPSDADGTNAKITIELLSKRNGKESQKSNVTDVEKFEPNEDETEDSDAGYANTKKAGRGARNVELEAPTQFSKDIAEDSNADLGYSPTVHVNRVAIKSPTPDGDVGRATSYGGNPPAVPVITQRDLALMRSILAQAQSKRSDMARISSSMWAKMLSLTSAGAKVKTGERHTDLLANGEELRKRDRKIARVILESSYLPKSSSVSNPKVRTIDGTDYVWNGETYVALNGGTLKWNGASYVPSKEATNSHYRFNGATFVPADDEGAIALGEAARNVAAAYPPTVAVQPQAQATSPPPRVLVRVEQLDQLPKRPKLPFLSFLDNILPPHVSQHISDLTSAALENVNTFRYPPPPARQPTYQFTPPPPQPPLPPTPPPPPPPPPPQPPLPRPPPPSQQAYANALSPQLAYLYSLTPPPPPAALPYNNPYLPASNPAPLKPIYNLPQQNTGSTSGTPTSTPYTYEKYEGAPKPSNELTALLSPQYSKFEADNIPAYLVPYLREQQELRLNATRTAASAGETYGNEHRHYYSWPGAASSRGASEQLSTTTPTPTFSTKAATTSPESPGKVALQKKLQQSYNSKLPQMSTNSANPFQDDAEDLQAIIETDLGIQKEIESISALFANSSDSASITLPITHLGHISDQRLINSESFYPTTPKTTTASTTPSLDKYLQKQLNQQAAVGRTAQQEMAAADEFLRREASKAEQNVIASNLQADDAERELEEKNAKLRKLLEKKAQERQYERLAEASQRVQVLNYDPVTNTVIKSMEPVSLFTESNNDLPLPPALDFKSNNYSPKAEQDLQQLNGATKNSVPGDLEAELNMETSLRKDTGALDPGPLMKDSALSVADIKQLLALTRAAEKKSDASRRGDSDRKFTKPFLNGLLEKPGVQKFLHLIMPSHLSSATVAALREKQLHKLEQEQSSRPAISPWSLKYRDPARQGSKLRPLSYATSLPGYDFSHNTIHGKSMTQHGRSHPLPKFFKRSHT